MVEVRAQLRHLRMSPKKVRLVTDAIKGKDVHEALVRLRFMRKAAALPVAKLLQSAIANAEHNNNLKKDDLIVKNVMVNQAIALKRWRPAAFGSAHGYKKHGTHIDLYLTLKPGVAEVASVKKAATKKAEKSSEKKVASDTPKETAKTEKKSEKKPRATKQKRAVTKESK